MTFKLKRNNLISLNRIQTSLGDGEVSGKLHVVEAILVMQVGPHNCLWLRGNENRWSSPQTVWGAVIWNTAFAMCWWACRVSCGRPGKYLWLIKMIPCLHWWVRPGGRVWAKFLFQLFLLPALLAPLSSPFLSLPKLLHFRTPQALLFLWVVPYSGPLTAPCPSNFPVLSLFQGDPLQLTAPGE